MEHTVSKAKKQILTKIRLKELESKQKQLQIEQRVLEIEQRKLEIKQIDEERNEVQTQIRDLIYELNQLPIGINKIPTEILLLIFRFLELLDLLRCRQVCRQWHAIIELMRLDSLVIFEKSLEIDDARWPYSLKAIDSRRSISVSRLNLLKCADSSFLCGLRRLKVQDAVKDDLQAPLIEFINRLGALEELYIWKLKNCAKGFEIRSNSLIYLTIFLVPIKGKPIIIDTPKLVKFTTDSGLEFLNFVHPHQVGELKLRDNLLFVSQFTGLQLLSCGNCRLERSDLKALSNLREIHFCHRVYVLARRTMKQNVLELLELKKQLNRSDLRILFRGILLDEAGQLDGYDSEEDNLTGLLMSNYNKLSDKLDWVRSLNFTVLNKWAGNGLPEDPLLSGFHSKFSEITNVNITDQIDNHLIQFLKHCKRFCSLSVRYSSLRAFHNQLEIIPSFIEILAVERKQQPDFKFFLNFCELNNPAEISREIALDVVQLAWQTIEKIQVIHLKIGSNRLQIEKKQTKFELEINNEPAKTFDHLEALIRFLDCHNF